MTRVAGGTEKLTGIIEKVAGEVRAEIAQAEKDWPAQMSKESRAEKKDAILAYAVRTVLSGDTSEVRDALIEAVKAAL